MAWQSPHADLLRLLVVEKHCRDDCNTDIARKLKQAVSDLEIIDAIADRTTQWRHAACGFASIGLHANPLDHSCFVNSALQN